jgi:hypothetical protein
MTSLANAGAMNVCMSFLIAPCAFKQKISDVFKNKRFVRQSLTAMFSIAHLGVKKTHTQLTPLSHPPRSSATASHPVRRY